MKTLAKDDGGGSRNGRIANTSGQDSTGYTLATYPSGATFSARAVSKPSREFRG